MPSAVEGCFDDVLKQVNESCGGHLLDQGPRALSGRRVAPDKLGRWPERRVLAIPRDELEAFLELHFTDSDSAMPNVRVTLLLRQEPGETSNDDA